MNYKEILIKLATGTATQIEREDFNKWIEKLSISDYNNVLLEYESIMVQQKVDHNYDDLLLQSIHRKIEQEEADSPAKVLSIKYDYKKWLMAAAAVLILVTSGYFFMLKSGEKLPTGMAHDKPALNNDAAPGGNKSTLTLADGTIIVLDSAANGNLTSQGNTRVIKLDDGQLTYQSIGAATEIAYNTISTPRGGQYQLILADGSKVWLNAASSLRFPASFAGNERRVELTGEGYFEVASSISPKGGGKKRFIVNVAGKGEVEVLGTHFNINAYGDESTINTTLLEGSVKITEINTHNSLLISPGQQAQIKLNGEINLTTNVDVDEVMAWKNGLFNFNNASLQAVLQQLSRWYDVDVEFKNGVPNRVFAGEMQRNLNLSQVLKLLEKNKVKFRIEGKKLIVL